jgi:hypothetical protein
MQISKIDLSHASCQSSCKIGMRSHNFLCSCAQYLPKNLGANRFRPLLLSFSLSQLPHRMIITIDEKCISEFLHELLELMLKLIEVALKIQGNRNSYINIDCCYLKKYRICCIDFLN